jgi:hypothetical protein
MVKKKFIQSRCVRKVPRLSFVCPSRVVIMMAPLSGGSSSSASSLLVLSALGACEAPTVEEAPPAETSKPVPSL